MARTKAKVLAEIRRNHRQLSNTKDRLEGLFRERDDLYTEARDMDPPLLQREIAEAAGVSEIAVTVQLRKLRAPKGKKAPTKKRK